MRGKQHMKLWLDEVAAWAYPDAFDQALLGLRLGDKPQAVITTTPRPIKLIKQLVDDEDAIVTRGSTFDNAHHLAEAFLKRIAARYQGRTIGRQELFAEIVEEAPGALWTRALIERQRLHRERGANYARSSSASIRRPNPAPRPTNAASWSSAHRRGRDPCDRRSHQSGRNAGPVGRARRRGLSPLQGQPRRRRNQQRRRDGRRGVAPERRQPARAHGHGDARQVLARRACGGGLRARDRASSRRFSANSRISSAR